MKSYILCCPLFTVCIAFLANLIIVVLMYFLIISDADDGTEWKTISSESHKPEIDYEALELPSENNIPVLVTEGIFHSNIPTNNIMFFF